MGQRTNQGHALGWNRQDYIKAETTPFTQEIVAAADAVKTINFQINGNQERADVEEWRAQRAVANRVTRRKTGTWSMEAHLRPSGVVGTAPDLGPLLKCALGLGQVDPTFVLYETDNTQAFGTFTAHQFFAGQGALATQQAYAKSARGCWVNTLSLSVNGTEPPKISAEGGCASVAHSGHGVVGATTSATTVSLGTGQGDYFEPGSLVMVNGASPRRVVSIAGDVLTLDASTSVTNGQVLTGLGFASPVTAGNPLGGIVGSLEIGGDVVSVVSFDVEVNNNHIAIEDEALAETTEDYIPGVLDVTGTIAVRARADYLKYMLTRKNFTGVDIEVTVGSVAGSRMQFFVRSCEIEFGEDQVPIDAEVVLQLPFKSLAQFPLMIYMD